MLFTTQHLNNIATGQITLAFRSWKKAAVKKGSLILTPVGRIEIRDISEVLRNEITEADAAHAGYGSLDLLLQALDQYPGRQLYKLSVRLHSDDPRIVLRTKEALSPDDLAKLNLKLKKLDQLSKSGEWTHKVLSAIAQNPELRAADLATLTGFEKEWLKLNIRKLKNLGLTISLETGYRISNLGEFVLNYHQPA